ncbi:DUF3515 domain-containing protein [uncultured Corynebacterium sp.]|uniref:DUF3515 domain-containing protein n=1 Tax=uncultured Corynebacterium sp. TaxID=159447 RepID=UPI00260116FE|nr:DUF3515 domain-containing protein [uncultured Corynebacterium sp.]
MSDQPASPIATPRYLLILSTVLAMVLIVAVIAAAKVTMDKKVYAPVALGPVDAPEASSKVCKDFVAALPRDLGRFRAVEVRDPAPEGAAAFRDSSGAELSVRCGVHVPDQYTVLSPVFSSGDADWTAVADATPGSDLRTWYAVGGSPAVAVTASADVGDALDGVGSTLSSLYDAHSPAQPAPYPLSTAPVAGDSGGSGKADGSGKAGTSGGSGKTGTSDGATESPVCRKFLETLPDSLGDWRLVHISAGSPKVKNADALPEGVDESVFDKAPSGSATYLAEGHEPVVIRCGLEMPEAYEPGAQLTQVDDVPWFSDPSLSRGSTIGHWYALGREQIVGLSMPQSAGEEVITSVTSAISDSLKKTEEKSTADQQ